MVENPGVEKLAHGHDESVWWWWSLQIEEEEGGKLEKGQGMHDRSTGHGKDKSPRHQQHSSCDGDAHRQFLLYLIRRADS